MAIQQGAERSSQQGAERSSTPVDKIVGARVRQRRVEIHMSQERLAELIGVSFQQLQKYESGANRIGASRLYAIASSLESPISYFFGEEKPVEKVGGFNEDRSLSSVLTDETSFEIVECFSKIDDHHLRRQLVDMLEAFCEKARRDDIRLKSRRK